MRQLSECPTLRMLQRHGHPEEKTEEFRFEYPFPLYVIFNPYSHDDEVHFADTEVCTCVLQVRVLGSVTAA